MSEASEMIKDILINEFSSVYCDTCANDEGGDCDDCNRKSMMWCLSDNAAENLSERIMLNIKNKGQ